MYTAADILLGAFPAGVRSIRHDNDIERDMPERFAGHNREWDERDQGEWIMLVVDGNGSTYCPCNGGRIKAGPAPF